MANLHAGTALQKEWVYMGSRVIFVYTRNDSPSPVPWSTSSTSSSSTMTILSAFICRLIYQERCDCESRLCSQLAGSCVRDDKYSQYVEKRTLSLRRRDVISSRQESGNCVKPLRAKSAPRALDSKLRYSTKLIGKHLKGHKFAHQQLLSGLSKYSGRMNHFR